MTLCCVIVKHARSAELWECSRQSTLEGQGLPCTIIQLIMSCKASTTINTVVLSVMGSMGCVDHECRQSGLLVVQLSRLRTVTQDSLLEKQSKCQ